MPSPLEEQLAAVSVTEPEEQINGDERKKEEPANGVKKELKVVNGEEKESEKVNGELKKFKLGMKPLAEKQPIIGGGAKMVNIATNIRKISLASNQPIYQYAVSVNFVTRSRNGEEQIHEISNSSKRAEMHEQDKERCKAVYRKAVEKFDCLKEGGPFFYDCQSTIWSLSKIKNEQLSFTIETGVCSRPNFIRAEFNLDPVKKGEISSSDVSNTVNACPALADQRLLDALGTIISETPNASKDVITIGGTVHYLMNSSSVNIRTIVFPEGVICSFVGASKSIRTLEGKEGNPELFMSTEMRASLFHPDYEPLIKVLESFRGFHHQLKKDDQESGRIIRALKGVKVLLDYGPFKGLGRDSLMMTICGFGKIPNEQTFEYNDVTSTVSEHFEKKYGIYPRFPQLMTIAAIDSHGQEDYFPPELLTLYPSQKVTNDRMINNEPKELIKLAGGAPHIRKDTTERVALGVGLVSGKFPRCISINLPISVTGKVLERPLAMNGPRGFYEAKSLKNWEIVFMQGEGLRGIESLLCEEMLRNGMDVNLPSIGYMTPRNLHELFQYAKENKKELLIIITKRMHDAHDYIKAAEQKFDILTQEIHFETASRVMRGGADTLKNIVRKTNIKLGGLNYLVQSDVLRQDVLVLGFASSQAATYTDSNIVSVGYASNASNNCHKFNGGYIFVRRNKDLFGQVIAGVLRCSLKATKKNRVKPEKVFIYLHGISEGMHALVNEEYVAKCYETFSSLKADYKPQLTIIASTKSHNERLYKDGLGQISNLEPGTVVDTTIVSPVLNEFYHVGGKALQGTAKAVKYTVIHSTEKVDLHKIETLTNDLCQDHQIVTTPTSLPTPIYVASRCSERGSKILKVNGGPIMKGGRVDYEKTNNFYGYSNKSLEGTRFNA